ncbi:hypothetical protein EIP91_004253 [Steccherinum ochraceum]|uniref:Protein kinase domain-containing protein n=1 Tax=Steccherinum ochraceum TaxID=92696 RepID=A0A4R0RBM3_9APHY|nr:hypothetical protein EIP91_004253 [Steccherinum ochraceum]
MATNNSDPGYTLRDDFRPDIQPSQGDPPSPQPWNEVPDGIDARIPGGKLVLVRRLATDSQELSLLLRFSQPEMRSAPGNLCVPVLDTFEDPENPSVTFVVTPYIFDMYHLRWRNVDDILNYFTRILEGLVFFHAHGISNVLSMSKKVYSVVRFDASSIIQDGNWNAVSPLEPLETPGDTFACNDCYYMRDTVPIYLFHLHDCKVETSVHDPKPSPPPAHRPPEHVNPLAQGPSSPACTVEAFSDIGVTPRADEACKSPDLVDSTRNGGGPSKSPSFANGAPRVMTQGMKDDMNAFGRRFFRHEFTRRQLDMMQALESANTFGRAQDVRSERRY